MIEIMVVNMLKRTLTAVSALVFSFSVCACGSTDESHAKRPSLESAFEIKSAEKTDSSGGSSEGEDTSKPDDLSSDDSILSSKETIEAHTVSQDMDYNEPKAVEEVSLYNAKCDDIKSKVTIRNLYGRHALHTAVVGLVGAPAEISFDKADLPKGALMQFIVNTEELRGVRTDALMFLWYDELNDKYIEYDKDTALEEGNGFAVCSMHIEEPGAYMLVNKYSWYNAWGAGIDDDGLEKGYEPGLSDLVPGGVWENEQNAGDIPSLVDEQYLLSSLTDRGADFKVSTAGQLATACYFVNCCDLDRYSERSVNITLEADIDLKGIEWSPMGWGMAGSDHRFEGVLIGNGHTIKNLTVAEGIYNSGFIGESCGCVVSDVKIENASVSGINQTGILIGQDVRSHIYDVKVSGKVSGGEAGPIIGSEAGASFYNCKADVIVNNGDDLGGALSYTRYIVKKLADEYGYPEKISIVGDNVVRQAGIEDSYDNLQWHFCVDGNSVFEGSRDVELSIKKLFNKVNVDKNCKYTVALYAFVKGYYIPISNEIELPVE